MKMDKRLSASRGLPPAPLQGLYPGPHWGLRPKTPVKGSSSVLAMVCLLGKSWIRLGLIDCPIDCGTGWLYDISNSYDYSFYMMGICLFISGLMKVLAHYLYERWRRRHEKDEQASETDEEDHVEMEPMAIME